MKRSSLVGKFLLLLTLLGALIYGAPTFPQLSGRVVDTAKLLNTEQIISLEQKLKEHEEATSNQVVVVTLTTLQGYEIEEYGYQLGRHWGIGQKGKDNGLLLIVAPNERKVRIEVGYGLEGIITDKMAHDIIQEQILPAFKRGDYASGIMQATQTIISLLNGESVFEGSGDSQSQDESFFGLAIVIFFFIYPLINAFVSKMSKKSKLYWSGGIGFVVGIIMFILTATLMIGVMAGIMAFMHSYLFNSTSSSSWSSWNSSGGYSGGSSFGGGFSGGGGSFGGGGASGSW
jgi:uncharacterized protein